MLTFEQALTFLKAGHDVRLDEWPRIEFLRALPNRKIVKIKVDRALATTTTPYVLSDAELFATTWRLA